MIHRESIELIKKKIKIDTLVQEMYGEESHGARQYAILCPFHSERTPSCHINVDSGFFYCFGCHASGDIITLAKNFYSVEFSEAVSILAEKAGVEIVDSESNPKLSRKVLLSTIGEYYSQARKDYLDLPELHPAKMAIAKRGLKNPNVGFIAKEGSAKSIDRDVAKACGIISDKGFEYFTGRLILPLLNENNQVVGLNGREVDGLTNPLEGRKYVNSPSTSLFSKKDFLLGMNLAKEIIRSKKAVLLCEGQFDLLALNEAGVWNAVAPLGTSFTEEQFIKLNRVPDVRFFLGFDWESSGRKAIAHALQNPYVRAKGFIFNPVFPECKDWGEILENHGVDGIREQLKNYSPAIEGVLTNLWKNAETPADKDRATADGYDFLSYAQAGGHWVEWWSKITQGGLAQAPTDLEPEAHLVSAPLVDAHGLSSIVLSVLLHNQDIPRKEVRMEITTIDDKLLDEYLKGEESSNIERLSQLSTMVNPIEQTPGFDPKKYIERFYEMKS